MTADADIEFNLTENPDFDFKVTADVDIGFRLHKMLIYNSECNRSWYTVHVDTDCWYRVEVQQEVN